MIYRLSVEDFFPGGLGFAEGKQIAMWAAEAGADALHISAGHYRSQPSAHVMIPPMTMREATFLDFASTVKAAVSVPVIAVGRLGDPWIATDAVATGKADFIALGRSLIADPQWVDKLRRNKPVRRCLACNTCVNDMRGGAGIGCVVNGAAGRELTFEGREPPQGERIAVIGAGPAGLTYASLVAAGNTVTVFERARHAGGAFRIAGKAPIFQEVAASEPSFERYIADLVADCEDQGVTFRFGVDATRERATLTGFDRIVVATGAIYRFGLRWPVTAALKSGAARWPGVARLFASQKIRDWFYYKARRSTAPRIVPFIRDGGKITVIGDAARPGKSKNAIASAFEAALLSRDA